MVSVRGGRYGAALARCPRERHREGCVLVDADVSAATELDLQVNLLSEYELTRVLTLVDSIAKKLGCDDCDDEELAELTEDVKPKEVLEELDSRASGNQKSRDARTS